MPRMRKQKFTEAELDILVDGVVIYINIIQGRNSTPTQKKSVWNSITNQINAITPYNRSHVEVRKRWYDVKRRSKEKQARNRQIVSSGGGPSQLEAYSSIEDRVLPLLLNEQVDGVLGGIDTAEPRQGRLMPSKIIHILRNWTIAQ